MNHKDYKKFRLFHVWTGKNMTEDDAKKIIVSVKNKKMPEPSDLPIVRAAATVGLPENDFKSLSTRMNDIWNKNNILLDKNKKPKSQNAIKQWNDLEMKVIQTEENGNSILYSRKTGEFYEYDNESGQTFDEMIKRGGIPYHDFINKIMITVASESYTSEELAMERLATRILEPGLGPKVTLFHGSDRKFDVVKANSVNMGNRVEWKELSSFWTNNFDAAVMHSTDWVFEDNGIPYGHRLADFKIIVPDGYIKDKTIYPVDKYPPGSTYISDLIRNIFNKHGNTYVYEADLPVSLVGRGQVPIGEYTIGVDVIPKKIHPISYDMIKAKIELLPWDEFKTVSKNGNFRKDSINLRERVIFRNPQKTLRKRARNYDHYEKILTNKKPNTVIQG